MAPGRPPRGDPRSVPTPGVCMKWARAGPSGDRWVRRIAVMWAGLDSLYYQFVEWDDDGGLDIVEARFRLLSERPCP